MTDATQTIYSASQPTDLEALRRSLHDKPLPPSSMAASGPVSAADRNVYDGDDDEQLHVVMVPYPLQGHINPMVQFAKALVAKHPCMRVTIINNKHNHDHRIHQQTCSGSLSTGAHSIETSNTPDIIPANSIHSQIDHHQYSSNYKIAPHNYNAQKLDDHEEKLQFLWVEDGLPPDFDYTDIPSRLSEFHLTITHKMKEPLKQLLQSLNQKRPPVSCVVFGSFCPWVHKVCVELGIPSFFFWTQSAAVFSIYHYHVPLLEANGFLPHNKRAASGCIDNDREKSQETAASIRELVSYVPGVPPLHPSSLPTFLHISSLSEHTIMSSIREQMSIVSDCQGVFVNSFEELEKDACQALQAELPFPIRLVGPLIPSVFLKDSNKNDASIGVSLLEERRDCIDWLNSQKRQSVLYVSFGSLCSPCAEDLRSIACGIRARKQPFLWVVRPTTSSANATDILPEDFMDDTKDYGLIIPWAPQVQVLSHPSVGAFLTHCGWNSVLESVSMAMPMISFPIFSDQPTNCTYICDVWKVGMALKRQGDGKVRSIDVERVVKTVLEEEEGEEMRKKAYKLREAARQAVGSQGSSGMHMDSFILSMSKKS